jgi:SAM-dependent methyltransferase
VEQRERDELIKREKMKYNLLYLEDQKYGGKSGRPKTFLRGNDEIHKSIKTAINESVTMLDIGCGRGFFVDMFRREYPHLQIHCVDIAAKEIKKTRPDLNIIEASADNLSMFVDGKFDLVTHLDGMEHIPAAIEEKAISEEIRVSNKYIYHQIATHEVARDKDWEKRGLGKVHINLKSADQWKKAFVYWSEKYKADIKYFVDYRQWVHVLLERRK